jgi:hypothetical protein
MIYQLQFWVENVGINKDFLFEMGVRDYYDKGIRRKGPFRYRQNGDSNGVVSCRANGVFHRFRFKSPDGNQFIRILAYTADVDDWVKYQDD